MERKRGMVATPVSVLFSRNFFLFDDDNTHPTSPSRRQWSHTTTITSHLAHRGGGSRTTNSNYTATDVRRSGCCPRTRDVRILHSTSSPLPQTQKTRHRAFRACMQGKRSSSFLPTFFVLERGGRQPCFLEMRSRRLSKQTTSEQTGCQRELTQSSTPRLFFFLTGTTFPRARRRARLDSARTSTNVSLVASPVAAYLLVAAGTQCSLNLDFSIPPPSSTQTCEHQFIQSAASDIIA